MKKKVLSLFTGAGGFDIGMEMAECDTSLCIEYDADCRETLRHNRPKWNLFEDTTGGRIAGDIRNISVDEAIKMGGQPDIIIGGAPCQPFSGLGKGKGSDDEKNGDLFLEYVRFIKGTNPSAFIFENVTGITNKKHQNVIDYMLDSFSGLGYGLSTSILNAADYGTPQKRKRFFLIGIKGVMEPKFPVPTHFKDELSYEEYSDIVGEYKKWISVEDAFGSLPEDHINRKDYKLMNISDIVKHRMTYIKEGENFKVVPKEFLPNCWKSGKHEGADTFGRLIASEPSVTIRTAAYNPSKGRYIHPFEDRGLSTIELASLQGFPYEWEFKSTHKGGVTLTSAGRQIGNAVPPPLACEIGKAILEQLS